MDPALPLFNPLAYGVGTREANHGLLRLRTTDDNLRAQVNEQSFGAFSNRNLATNPGSVITYGYSRGEDGRSYVTKVDQSHTHRERLSGLEENRDRPLSTRYTDPDWTRTQATNLSLSPLAQEMLDRADAAQKANYNSANLETGPSFGPEQSAAETLALRELQQADATVRSHEGLHFRAAGGVASGIPQYQYTVGPDGRLYATGGNVEVRSTPTADRDKALEQAANISRAATAPGDASVQDLVAAREAYRNADSRLEAKPQQPDSPAPTRPNNPQPVNLLV